MDHQWPTPWDKMGPCTKHRTASNPSSQLNRRPLASPSPFPVPMTRASAHSSYSASTSQPVSIVIAFLLTPPDQYAAVWNDGSDEGCVSIENGLRPFLIWPSNCNT